MMLPHEDVGMDEQQQPSIRLQPPTDDNTEERLNQIDELKYFLGTATNDWESDRQVHSFPLPTGESLSCVFWNDLFHVTGTDIVRTLLYRFHLFGRPVTNLKKFEEGIFSDLRNLKPGMDASLEEPKSEFLEMLYKNNCIRTQKKQKVFFWFSVPHDRLFLDALERDLKREKMNLEPTSVAIAEPATSLSLDTTQELFDQLRKSMSLSAVAAAHAMDELPLATTADEIQDDWPTPKLGHRTTRSLSSIIIPPTTPSEQTSFSAGTSPKSSHLDLYPSKSFDEKQKIFGAFSLFEGSPSYKQRQRRRTLSFNFMDEDHGGSRLELAAMNAGLAIINPHNLFQSNHSQNNHHHHQHHHEQPSSEKVYTCPLPQCARLFKRLEHLKRHFRTHTMERPYSCNMCGKHFSRTDNLAQHKKTHNRTRSSSVISRCNSSSSSSKLATASPDVDHAITMRRKRASSLRNNCSEIIDKLAVLSSHDAPVIPAVNMDYFSYRGDDLRGSTTSPSGSAPLSDEEIMYNHNYEIPYQITDEDIYMTDENEMNHAESTIMYDEEDEHRQPTHDQSLMWHPTNSSPLLFHTPPQQQQQQQQQQEYYHRLSWYSSIGDKSVSPNSSPSS
ncbi:hypothetical protein INT47_004106, partial [Mucor saturninus]